METQTKAAAKDNAGLAMVGYLLIGLIYIGFNGVLLPIGLLLGIIRVTLTYRANKEINWLPRVIALTIGTLLASGILPIHFSIPISFNW